MNQKESNIIATLIKVASNQQKIIEKLAQQLDQNVKFFQNTANTAVFNAGLRGASIEVTPDGDSYVIKVNNVPEEDNAGKQKFIDQFNNMVESQKPDLAGKFSLIF